MAEGCGGGKANHWFVEGSLAFFRFVLLTGKLLLPFRTACRVFDIGRRRTDLRDGGRADQEPREGHAGGGCAPAVRKGNAFLNE